MKYFMKVFLLLYTSVDDISLTIKSVSRIISLFLETLLEIVTAYARNSRLSVKNVTPKGVFFRAS